MSAVTEQDEGTTTGRRRGSILVAAGIFLSRVSGVFRQAAVNHFFGVSSIADAFTAAFKIPNLMQNLLGEGVLSASFIPVYARLLEEGKEEEAGRVAGAVAGLLAAAAGAFTVLAVLGAAPLTTLIAPGFTGPKYELTVSLMRIITPGVAVLVLSAWCLGILNSHRRFFLSYVAPVVWNVAQIAVVIGAGIVLLDDPLDPGAASLDTLGTLVRALAVGTVVGGVLQFAVQLPSVLKLEPHLRPSLRRDIPGVRRVLRALGPVVAGRGVVQLSAYIDLVLASLLAAGATAALQNALLLYLLPISLFGMSIAAAELPELSRERAGAEVLGPRLDRGLSSMAFYVLPTALVFLVVGDLVIGALFSRGAFGRPDEILVWITLAAFCLGLMASTSSRLLQSALYAVGDTRTPARAAAERVVISTLLGVVFMLQLDQIGIVDGSLAVRGSLPAIWTVDASLRESTDVLRLGAAGLALGAVGGAWYEFRRLQGGIQDHFGITVRSGGSHRGRLVLPAIVAVLVGVGMRFVVFDWPRLLGGPAAAGAMGLAFVLVALGTDVGEAHTAVDMVARRLSLGDRLTIWRGQRRRRHRD